MMPQSDLCRPVVLGEIVEVEIELSHSLPKEKREFSGAAHVTTNYSGTQHSGFGNS